MKNLRDSYKFYTKNYERKVDLNTYLHITQSFMIFIVKTILGGDEVVLPGKLGLLSISGKKQNLRLVDGKFKGLSPNWPKTKKLWEKSEDAKQRKQLVFNTNEHSDSIRYKFFWSKIRSTVENKTLYTLVMSRKNKRTLSALIKEGQEYHTR